MNYSNDSAKWSEEAPLSPRDVLCHLVELHPRALIEPYLFVRLLDDYIARYSVAFSPAAQLSYELLTRLVQCGLVQRMVGLKALTDESLNRLTEQFRQQLFFLDTPISRRQARKTILCMVYALGLDTGGLHRFAGAARKKSASSLQPETKTRESFPKGQDIRISLPENNSIGLVWCPQEASFSRRPVKISYGFWMGRYPVTQAQYQILMHENHSWPLGAGLSVNRVSWMEAVLFCRRLNALCIPQLPVDYELSLPACDQWKYACKFVGDSKHWSKAEQPTVCRLTNMHEKVWEWCSDRYGCQTHYSRGSCDVGFRVALTPKRRLNTATA